MLSVRQLNVTLGGRRVLEGLDLELRAGEMLALVGQSGAGKSSAALAMLRLLPEGAATGEVRLEGTDLLRLSERRMRGMRGARIGFVFQDALAALNPVHRVGSQIAEPVRIHGRATAREARARAEQLLADMGLPARAARAYPHELSGGQRQRAMVAAALAGGPCLLIADEPTAGLDGETAAALLALLAGLRRRGLAVLLITHDLAIAAAHADNVQVLEAGRPVERQPAAALFAAPRHAATRALLAAVPSGAALAGLPEPGREILRARDVGVRYPGADGWAVRDACFSLHRGECLGVVGESGSGKTTLGRAILRLVEYEGEIEMPGGWQRRRVQPVFQDPAQSLNPRFTVMQAVAEPLRIAGVERGEHGDCAAALLHRVGLAAELLRRPVGTLSGGQAQRVAIARALATAPDVLVLDEPASALDAASAAALLRLLLELMQGGMALVLISHDRLAVRSLCRRRLRVEGGRVRNDGAIG